MEKFPILLFFMGFFILTDVVSSEVVKLNQVVTEVDPAIELPSEKNETSAAGIWSPSKSDISPFLEATQTAASSSSNPNVNGAEITSSSVSKNGASPSYGDLTSYYKSDYPSSASRKEVSGSYGDATSYHKGIQTPSKKSNQHAKAIPTQSYGDATSYYKALPTQSYGDVTSYYKAIPTQSYGDATSYYKAIPTQSYGDVTSYYKAIPTQSYGDVTSYYKAIPTQSYGDVTSYYKAIPTQSDGDVTSYYEAIPTQSYGDVTSYYKAIPTQSYGDVTSYYKAIPTQSYGDVTPYYKAIPTPSYGEVTSYYKAIPTPSYGDVTSYYKAVPKDTSVHGTMLSVDQDDSSINAKESIPSDANQHSVVDNPTLMHHKKNMFFFRMHDLKIGGELVLPPLAEDALGTRKLLTPRLEAVLGNLTLPHLLSVFGIPTDSIRGRKSKINLERCHAPPMQNEKKACVASTRSMQRFARSMLPGNDPIKQLTVSRPQPSTEHFKIVDMKLVTHNSPVTCHPMVFPYALFMCHVVPNSLSLQVTLQDDRGELVVVPVMCHMDTSGFDPSHLAFKLLHTKPAEGEICHWVSNSHIIWYT